MKLIANALFFSALILAAFTARASTLSNCQANLIGSYQALLDAAHRDGDLTVQDLIKVAESISPHNPFAAKMQKSFF